MKTKFCKFIIQNMLNLLIELISVFACIYGLCHSHESLPLKIVSAVQCFLVTILNVLLMCKVSLSSFLCVSCCPFCRRKENKYARWEIIEIAKEKIKNIDQEITILKELKDDEDAEYQRLLMSLKEKNKERKVLYEN